MNKNFLANDVDVWFGERKFLRTDGRENYYLFWENFFLILLSSLNSPTLSLPHPLENDVFNFLKGGYPNGIISEHI